MRDAITTQYLSPTNNTGARIVARADCDRLVIGYDSKLDALENHRRAAMTLASRLNWPGRWYAGVMPRGYVFVSDSDQRAESVLSESDDPDGQAAVLADVSGGDAQ